VTLALGLPHKLRDTDAGRFHVYTHCVWAVPAYFQDDLDRFAFLQILDRVTRSSGWKCIAFCLMTSHYHLIVEVDDGVLPAAMKPLNHSYSWGHNRRYRLRGHAQHQRYGSRRIVDNPDLLDAFSYVSWNPPNAGMCEKPEDWRWSSYAAAVGLAAPHSFVDDAPLLACFRGSVDPRAALRRHVEESPRRPRR
jgi:REP element-mobilizing transposase RayT